MTRFRYESLWQFELFRANIGNQGEENLEDVEPEAIPDLSSLEGKKVNKMGNIVDDKVGLRIPHLLV